MGKIMGKLKHHYNAFPELQTKFFSKTCVIWSFPQSLKNFITYSIFSKFQVQVNIRKKLTTTGVSHYSFPTTT